MNTVLILAAGKGTRMNSEKPKVMHAVGGRPMIERVVREAGEVVPRPIVVIGYGQEEVRACLEGQDVEFVVQEEQLGTGHAVACAKDAIIASGAERVLVIPGDHPLVQAKTLQRIMETHVAEGATVTLAAAILPSYEGDFEHFLHNGRIVRGANGDVAAIVEYKDGNAAERAIREVNVSNYCFDAQWLLAHLDRLETTNASNEYYVTDLLKLAAQEQAKIVSCRIDNYWEGMGANTADQLATLEAILAENASE